MPSQEERDRIYDGNKPSSEDAQKIQDYQTRLEELVRKIKDAEDTEINRLKADNTRQAEEIERLREALDIILPMAKGYAAEHPVGRNQEIINETIAKAAIKGEKEADHFREIEKEEAEEARL